MPSRPAALRVAALTAATLVATGLAVASPAIAAGPKTPHVHPVDPVQRTTPLTTVDLGGVAQPRALVAPSVTVAKAAARSAEAVGTGLATAALTPAITVKSGISVVGATWPDGAMPAAARLLIRTSKGGTWSAWQALDSDDGHDPDPGTAEAAHERGGTQPYVVTDASAVQVRLDTASGTAPQGASVDVVDPGTSSADAQVGTATAGAAQAAAAQPTIYSRADWGADESLRRAAPVYGSIQAAFVHHTVSQNDYSAAEVPAIIRGIYAFHVNGRGWNDIGYNFLVDRFGRIWEGRYGGIALPVVGAHTKGYNSESFAMSAIGDYDTAHVPSAIVSAYERLFAWKLSLHGVPAVGTVVLNGKRINRISGHRDVESTICPGRYLYADLPAIRAGTAARMGTLPRPQLARSLDGNGSPDLLASPGPTASTSLLVSDAQSPVGGSSVVGASGWDSLGLLTVSADLTGDHRADLVARVPSTGRLRVYAGTGTGHFIALPDTGSGWNSITHLIAPGDVTGDGRADLLAVNAAGQLRLYIGDGAGGVRYSGVVGASGWNAMSIITGVGDATGDGRPDLVAVNASTHLLYLYPGAGGGHLGARREIGSGWQVADRLFGAGDVDGDGRVDFVAREAGTGRMRTYFGTGTGSFGTMLRWGSSYQNLSTVIGGADLNGDGIPDQLGVYHGELLLYPGTGQREFSASSQLGVDLQGTDHAFVVGDVNRDGYADVVARDTATGNLELWTDPGRSSTPTAPRVIGTGWSGMNLIAPAGDITMDGVPDILARSASTGTLYVYPLTTTGAFKKSYVVATGMGSMTEILGVGPNDADAAPDVIARSSSGQLLLYPGNGPGLLLPPRVVRNSTSTVAQFVGSGDVDGNGTADLVARLTTGQLYLYPGAGGTGGYLTSRSLVQNTSAVGHELG